MSMDEHRGPPGLGDLTSRTRLSNFALRCHAVGAAGRKEQRQSARFTPPKNSLAGTARGAEMLPKTR
jgi:hypothetical protein